jgi:hypothetical protein
MITAHASVSSVTISGLEIKVRGQKALFCYYDGHWYARTTGAEPGNKDHFTLYRCPKDWTFTQMILFDYAGVGPLHVYLLEIQSDGTATLGGFPASDKAEIAVGALANEYDVIFLEEE